VFDYRDAYQWFEHRGVKLTTQEDHCVFPQSQDSHTIINLFLNEAHRLGVTIKTNCKVNSLDELSDYDFIAITTGGSTLTSLQWLKDLGHEIETPVPSLFTFELEKSSRIQDLMGTVVENATLQIPGTKFKSDGPLLITHWGVSGPATLRLSSYAARWLHEHNYHAPLSINWLSQNENEVQTLLAQLLRENANKQILNCHPSALPQRLWEHIILRSLKDTPQKRCSELGKKDIHRLINTLINDNYPIVGRAAFKDEFVTCGGISLSSINSNTLESKHYPRLYFAGEVLDIDGVTGGFNFQAAWTTAHTVASAIFTKALS
jgi:predicted Rossmann fold flavoprotein